MKWPAPPQRMPKDAPNILIVLLDDVSFGVADMFDAWAAGWKSSPVVIMTKKK